MDAEFDTTVRVRLLGMFVESGRAPSTAALAAELGESEERVRTSMERLALGKAIVLQPESRELLMAAPLSALPTPYVAHVGSRSYFAPCAWDALGVPAMLEADGWVETSCPCCGEAMRVEVRGGEAEAREGVIHFALPAKQWWQNIVFT